MEPSAYIPILISILAFLFSLYAHKKIYTLRAESFDLNYKKIITEQLEECRSILSDEFWKIKPELHKLSTMLNSTNTLIGELLDKHDNRGYYHNQTPLRHAFVDIYNDVTSSLKHSVSLRSAEGTYYSLGIIKQIDSRFVPNKELREKKPAIEHRLVTEVVANSSIYISNYIDRNKENQVYYEFVDICQKLIKSLNDISIQCKDSYATLEVLKSKNNLQVFKIRHHPELDIRYTQFMCLLDLIMKCNINTLSKNKHEIPHLAVNQIIYFGANIDLINQILCSTIFCFTEQ